MPKKRRTKKFRKALAFLQGELLRDGYDNGDRLRRLLWADEEKYSDGFLTSLYRDTGAEQQDMPTNADNQDWIDELDDEDIKNIWSEILSMRNVRINEIPTDEYYIEIENDGISTTFSLQNLTGTAEATKSFLRAKEMFLHQYLKQRTSKAGKSRREARKEQLERERAEAEGGGAAKEKQTQSASPTKREKCSGSRLTNHKATKINRKAIVKNNPEEHIVTEGGSVDEEKEHEEGEKEEEEGESDEESEEESEQDSEDFSLDDAQEVQDGQKTAGFHATEYHAPPLPENIKMTMRVGVKGNKAGRVYAAQKHRLRAAVGRNIDRKIQYINSGGDLRNMWTFDADALKGEEVSLSESMTSARTASMAVSSGSNVYDEELPLYVRFIRLPPSSGSPGGWEGSDVGEEELGLSRGWSVLETAGPTIQPAVGLHPVLLPRNQNARGKSKLGLSVKSGSGLEDEQRVHKLGGNRDFHTEYCRVLGQHLLALYRKKKKDFGTITATGQSMELCDVKKSVQALYAYSIAEDTDRELLMKVDIEALRDDAFAAPCVEGSGILSDHVIFPLEADGGKACNRLDRNGKFIGGILDNTPDATPPGTASKSPHNRFGSMDSYVDLSSTDTSLYQREENEEGRAMGFLGGNERDKEKNEEDSRSEQGSEGEDHFPGDTHIPSQQYKIIPVATPEISHTAVSPMKNGNLDPEVNKVASEDIIKPTALIAADPLRAPLPPEFSGSKTILAVKKTETLKYSTYMVYEERRDAPTFEELTRNLDEEHKGLVSPRKFVPVQLRNPFVRNGKEYFSSPRREELVTKSGAMASYVHITPNKGIANAASPAREASQEGRLDDVEDSRALSQHKEGRVLIISSSEASRVESKKVVEAPIRVPVVPSMIGTAQPSSQPSTPPAASRPESDEIFVRKALREKAREQEQRIQKSKSDEVQLEELSSMILRHIESRGGLASLRTEPKVPLLRLDLMNKGVIMEESDGKGENNDDEWGLEGALGDLVRRLTSVMPPQPDGHPSSSPPTESRMTSDDVHTVSGTNKQLDSVLFDHVAYTWATMPAELQRRAAALSSQKESLLRASVMKNLRPFALKAQAALQLRLENQAREIEGLKRRKEAEKFEKEKERKASLGVVPVLPPHLKELHTSGKGDREKKDRQTSTLDPIDPATTAIVPNNITVAFPPAPSTAPAGAHLTMSVWFDEEDGGMMARRQGTTTTIPRFGVEPPAEEIAHIVTEGDHLPDKPENTTIPRLRDNKVVIKRDATINAEQTIAAAIGLRPEKRKPYPRPRFTMRVADIEQPEIVEAAPVPRPPTPEPVVPAPAPPPKEEKAKFTVSPRGTLIWHEAKNVPPGSGQPTIGPFGSRKARPSERHDYVKPSVQAGSVGGKKFEFLTSLQESEGKSTDPIEPPRKKTPIAPQGHASVSQKIRQQHQRLAGMGDDPLAVKVLEKLSDSEAADNESMDSTNDTHMRRKRGEITENALYVDDIEATIKEDTDPSPLVGAVENEEGSVLLLESNQVMQIFVPLLLEQAGLAVGTTCESLQECSKAVSHRNSHLAYADHDEAYEYVFVSYTDILIANVDNVSECRLKDTEEENKVLHFVYNFKKKARAAEEREKLLKERRRVSSYRLPPRQSNDDKQTSKEIEEPNKDIKNSKKGKQRLGDIKWSDDYLARINSTAESILDIKVAAGAKMVCLYNIPESTKEMDDDVRDLWLYELGKAGVVDFTISGDMTREKVSHVLEDLEAREEEEEEEEDENEEEKE